jgi:TonB-linked SusC/RagA family outer membrane protein
MRKIRFRWDNFSRYLKKLFLIAKLTTLLCFVGFISVSASIPSEDIITKYKEADQPQTKKITGTVNDVNGNPVLGATIVVEGTTIGTITDFNGAFTLEIPVDSKTLTISFIGYTSQNIQVENNTTFNIILEESNVELDEVVVVGYGTQKKESVLSAINQIKADDILETGSTNMVNALNGLSPGLNIVVKTGQPGADDGQIFIRGNADPLILIDGVEVVGGFSNIDPRDVESISTLKDGAATAVYGIRGANGVIIITTKRGKMGKPKISYTSEVSYKSPTTIPDVLDAYTAQSALNVGILNDQAYGAGYSSESDLEHWRNGDLPYLYPDIDWFDIMLKESALSQNHSVDIRGGTEFVKYYASIGYLQEGDIVQTTKLFNYDPEFNFQRYSFRGNLDFALTKTTTLKTSVSSRFEDRNQPRASGNSQESYGAFFGGLYNSAPGGTYPMYPAEVMLEYPDPLYPGIAEYRVGSGVNPFAMINSNGVNRHNKAIYTIDFDLEQKLDFITKGLTFNGKYNYISSYANSENITWNGEVNNRLDTYTLQKDASWFSFEGRNYERPLEFNLGNESIEDTEDITYYRLQLNYDNSFGKNNVTAMGLFSRNKRVNGTQYPYYNEDWVGRVTYNYDLRYFVEFSGAYNGDETFARGYRFKLFPSVALGYNIAKERIVSENLPFINNFKIRYSYGQAGDKSGLGNNRWQYLSFYDYIKSQANSRFYFGEDINDPLTVLGESQLGNIALSWATVTKQNIGVDFGFFENKLSGNLEFFNDEREDLINRPSATVPGYFGSSVKLPYANIGASKSHGYEASLTYKKRTSYGLSYSITGFYAFNENRVVLSAADGPGTPEYTKVAGKPSGVKALLQADGYFQSIDELVNYPDYAGNPGLGDYRYIDYNANGTVVGNALEDQVRFDLPVVPKNSYSLRLSGSYKGWSFSALINGVSGHKGLISESLAYAIPSGAAAGRPEQLDYWTTNNRDAQYPALHAVGNPNLTSAHTARIMNLDYLKLRSLNLGYDFDMSKFKTLSKLKVYISGNDLFTISNIDYGDPEGNSAGTLYPIIRRINLGVNASF